MWIRSTQVVIGDGDYRVQPAAIEIVDERIAAVVPWDQAPDGVDDLGDHLISPAFIDGHVHLALVSVRDAEAPLLARGNIIEDLFYQVESKLTAQDVRALARVAAYESLLNGVGMVFDHYYFADALAEGLRDAGLSAVIAPTVQDVHGPGVGQWEDQLDAVERIAARSDLSRVGIFSAYGPHATDTVSGKLWKTLVDHSGRTGLPLHFHCAQSPEEVERAHARAGVSPLRWLHDLGVLERRCLMVHNLYLTEDDYSLLRPDRHILGVCPYSQHIFGFLADVRRWVQAGVPFLVGTDCPSTNDSANVQKELRQLAAFRTLPIAFSEGLENYRQWGDVAHARLVRDARAACWSEAEAWTDPRSLLRRVWEIPGKLHPHARAGVVAPGALANLVVWDTTHPSFWPGTDPLHALAMGDTTGAIHHMMVAGRWRGLRGDYHRSLLRSDAWRDARREASARRDALLSG